MQKLAHKLHIADAKAQGFIIDDCCNPPFAYKGPRFQPTSSADCFTELESNLLKQQEALLQNITVLNAKLHTATEALQEAEPMLAKMLQQIQKSFPEREYKMPALETVRAALAELALRPAPQDEITA